MCIVSIRFVRLGGAIVCVCVCVGWLVRSFVRYNKQPDNNNDNNNDEPTLRYKQTTARFEGETRSLVISVIIVVAVAVVALISVIVVAAVLWGRYPKTIPPPPQRHYVISAFSVSSSSVVSLESPKSVGIQQQQQ